MPFIIHIPGMDSQKDCNRNVNLLDLYPTLIELCGLPAKELDGKSFKPLFGNPELPWDPTVTTADKGNHSVMSEKWHLIAYNDGSEELYSMEQDPMEWKNLASVKTPELEQVKAHLRTFIPKDEVDSIKDSKGKKSGNDGEESSKSDSEKPGKTVDPTIKPRRNLAELK